MNEIQIRSEAPKYRISLPQLARTTRQILETLGFKNTGLSILLTTDPKIRVINRKHLGHDYATDVISFGQVRDASHRSTRAPEGFNWCAGPWCAGVIYLGDLVISLDTTKRQAKEYGNSFGYELAFYICHGILHLMGYDDNTSEAARRMDRIQKETLEKIGGKEKVKRKKGKIKRKINL